MNDRRSVLLSLRLDLRGVGLHGHRRAQSGAFGPLPDPHLRQRRRPVRADGRRVPGDDPGGRLCRRRRRPVPVRRHDARRRLRRAAPGRPQLSSGRRLVGLVVPGRAAARPRRLGDRPRECRHGHHRADPGGDGRSATPQALGCAALHPLCLFLPGGRRRAPGGHDRRHRAHAAPQAVCPSASPSPSRTRAPRRRSSRSIRCVRAKV